VSEIYTQILTYNGSPTVRMAFAAKVFTFATHLCPLADDDDDELTDKFLLDDTFLERISTQCSITTDTFAHAILRRKQGLPPALDSFLNSTLGFFIRP